MTRSNAFSFLDTLTCSRSATHTHTTKSDTQLTRTSERCSTLGPVHVSAVVDQPKCTCITLEHDTHWCHEGDQHQNWRASNPRNAGSVRRARGHQVNETGDFWQSRPEGKIQVFNEAVIQQDEARGGHHRRSGHSQKDDGEHKKSSKVRIITGARVRRFTGSLSRCETSTTHVFGVYR